MAKGSTVLVVDDDANLLLMLEMVLNSAGYDVLTAGSAMQAWEVLKAHTPEVVLLDWMMPECDGGTFCRQVKQSSVGRGIAVVMMSCDERLASQAPKFGADGYVLKPFDISDVLASVERAGWKRNGSVSTEPIWFCAS